MVHTKRIHNTMPPQHLQRHNRRIDIYTPIRPDIRPKHLHNTFITRTRKTFHTPLMKRHIPHRTFRKPQRLVRPITQVQIKPCDSLIITPDDEVVAEGVNIEG